MSIGWTELIIVMEGDDNFLVSHLFFFWGDIGKDRPPDITTKQGSTYNSKNMWAQINWKYPVAYLL